MSRKTRSSTPALEELIEVCHQSRMQQPKRPLYPEKVRDLVKYFYNHGHSISKLKEMTGLSESYIRRAIQPQQPISEPAKLRLIDVEHKPEPPLYGREILMSLKTSCFRVDIFAEGGQ